MLFNPILEVIKGLFVSNNKKRRNYLLMAALTNQQIVTSKGICHGLPTFPPETKGLIAIVTGANGISGYHMVKVLSAAPSKWSKIYCLSRSAPPHYFYKGLGERATRVKHIAVNFLDNPASIAETLKNYVDQV